MRGAPRGDHALSSPRVVIYSTILVASLVPPVYLFMRSFLHRDASDAVVAVVCGVLYLLVLSRLWDVASFQRRAMEDEVARPSTVYGISKLTGEHLLSHFTKTGALTGRALRYFFVYGPRQWAGMGYKSVIIKNAERLLGVLSGPTA